MNWAIFGEEQKGLQIEYNLEMIFEQERKTPEFEQYKLRRMKADFEWGRLTGIVIDKLQNIEAKILKTYRLWLSPSNKGHFK